MWEAIAGTAKQNKLTAGTNITIDSNNVISASGGGKKLYNHYVRIIGSRGWIITHLITDNENAYNLSSLKTYLQSLTGVSEPDCILANGYVKDANNDIISKNVFGIYCKFNNIYIEYNDLSDVYSYTDMQATNVSDKVFEI